MENFYCLFPLFRDNVTKSNKSSESDKTWKKEAILKSGPGCNIFSQEVEKEKRKNKKKRPEHKSKVLFKRFIDTEIDMFPI